MRTSHAALFLLILCTTLRADRVAPRPKPTDYPARVTVGPLDIAADYLVHSFFGSEHDQMFFTADFLVVEVAFYPDSGRTYRVDTPKFSLRLNGKKGVLFPESPDTVAYTLKYADADRRPRVEAGAGRGDVMVAVGAPARVPRFPGDPTGGEYPQRQPPRVPDTTGPNVPKSVSATVDQVIKQTALEDGEKSGAVAGYLFFAYRENVKKIKSVDLLYDDATGGIATLRLREPAQRQRGYTQRLKGGCEVVERQGATTTSIRCRWAHYILGDGAKPAILGDFPMSHRVCERIWCSPSCWW